MFYDFTVFSTLRTVTFTRSLYLKLSPFLNIEFIHIFDTLYKTHNIDQFSFKC